MAALLGAAPDEIVFSGCGTESDNTASPGRPGNPARQASYRHQPGGAPGHQIPGSPTWPIRVSGSRRSRSIAEGHLDLDRYRSSLSPDTAIVSLMWANNETGVIFPVEEAAAMAREKGILFHTDAVQAVGKIPIDLKDTAIDMLSLSGHKLHAPKGVGVLYVRRGTKFSPLHHRRPSGKRPARRDREHRQHHRAGQGL